MPWLSLTDVAEIYSCSTRTIRRKIKRGNLTSKLSDGLRMVWLSEQVHTVSSHKSTVPKERDMIPLFELYEGLSILRMPCECHSGPTPSLAPELRDYSENVIRNPARNQDLTSVTFLWNRGLAALFSVFSRNVMESRPN